MPISANFDKPKCWGHLDGLIYAFTTSVNTLRATYEEITNTTKTTISCEFEYIFLILGQKYVYMRRGNVFYTRIDHTYQVRRPADNRQYCRFRYGPNSALCGSGISSHAAGGVSHYHVRPGQATGRVHTPHGLPGAAPCMAESSETAFFRQYCRYAGERIPPFTQNFARNPMVSLKIGVAGSKFRDI